MVLLLMRLAYLVEILTHLRLRVAIYVPTGTSPPLLSKIPFLCYFAGLLNSNGPYL